eukprot:NODE_550_length_2340_cov_107.874605_g522_i0.p1 GENE.NODE_550_length_2340_cov_107.874605_g522_i0~~NODE_550_length_2340_cov_107.874605_g522_i0.p1  ORF type:complete len:152 (+),score=3.06 NODE_550_length_2340_cov_107.874605_g522_i0:1778-2233(+)
MAFQAKRWYVYLTKVASVIGFYDPIRHLCTDDERTADGKCKPGVSIVWLGYDGCGSQRRHKFPDQCGIMPHHYNEGIVRLAGGPGGPALALLSTFWAMEAFHRQCEPYPHEVEYIDGLHWGRPFNMWKAQLLLNGLRNSTGYCARREHVTR